MSAPSSSSSAGPSSKPPPPAASTDSTQKDKLSRALGAAFLAHQVSELERSVDTLSFSRDPRLYQPQQSGSSSSTKSTGRKEVRIVDASALVHALPVLKRWVREDSYTLIVPLQAISVLDMLKKAPPPLHDLARDATRFLETQLNIAKQISNDPPSTNLKGGGEDPRIRLRAQKKGEELSWDEVVARFVGPEPLVKADEEVTEDGEEEEQQERVITANDIPKFLRPTIQCALYFSRLSPPPPAPTSATKPTSSSSSSKTIPPSLVIHSLSLPPLLPQLQLSSSSQPQPQQQPLDYPTLSSGDTLSHYLSNYFLSSPSPPTSSSEPPPTLVQIYQISTSEIVAAKEWAKRLALAKEREKEGNNNAGGRDGRGRGRGRGRGDERGRGGRGGGGGSGRGEGRKLFVP